MIFEKEGKWFCAQVGAREHYAIPRALHRAGTLSVLATDIWTSGWPNVTSKSPRGLKRLAGRNHFDLKSAAVHHASCRFIATDLWQVLKHQSSEAFHTRRNRKFDRFASKTLSQCLRNQSDIQCVFSYSHSCQLTFAASKSAGLTCVMGQFDPGPREADIVDEEHSRFTQFKTSWVRYSDQYRSDWWHEIELADRIIVNSQWSEHCLAEVGVPRSKIRRIPLVYESSKTPVKKSYPASFNRQRPLKVLFLGQVILRKGIARIIEASKHLKSQPIEFHLVGPTDIHNLEELCMGLPIVIHGIVSRSDVSRIYAESDLFILPTLSDGYAITLLEAKSNGLPIIASDRCGEVVRHDVDGWVLHSCEPENIAEQCFRCLEQPSLLARWSAAINANHQDFDWLAEQLHAAALNESVELRSRR